MDSLNHAAQGIVLVTIGEALTHSTGVEVGGLSVSVGIGAALVGAAPDAIGFIEKLVKRDWNAWNWYVEVHRYEVAVLVTLLAACAWIFGLLPLHVCIAYSLAYWLHLKVDRHTHVDMGARDNWFPPSEMWKLDFWRAIRWCKWNWISWGGTISVFTLLRVLS